MKRKIRFRGAFRGIYKMANAITPSRWGQVRIICDFFFCKLVFRCDLEEYRLYEFYKYKNAYRKDFILKSHQKNQFYSINPVHFTKHKKMTYPLIQRGIQRDLLYLPEADEQQFLAFVKKHGKIITKPDTGSLGWHIQLFEYTDDEQALAFYHSLQEPTICEEYIHQHEDMSRLNPSSVNSIRVVSLRDGEEVTFIAASLKSGGKANTILDNLHNHGVGASVDIESGVVLGKAYDYHNNTYIHHPVTGTQIVGFAVPYWKETLELIRQTHQDVAQCPYLGWDVAITPTGPEIIEINGRPGPKLIQLMDQKPKGRYLKDYKRKHKKDLSKK